ncbi:MAG: hypothetical protein ABW352_17265 [Polyangiales bacterium]
MNQRRQLRARKRQRQQGAALLIVLFVLLMATTTAVYSLSSTQFEVRAAGALHQAMRAKFVSEAAATAVVTLCQQKGTGSCVDQRNAFGNLNGQLRQTYALPDWQAETVYALTPANFQNNGAYSTTFGFVPDDLSISGSDVGGSGAASGWSPDFLLVYERWDIPRISQAPITRLVVSSYGALNYDVNRDAVVDDVRGTNEERFAHSTISATRAFVEIPE